MGICFSCCWGSRSNEAHSNNLSHSPLTSAPGNQTYELDEYNLPIKFELGEQYPQTGLNISIHGAPPSSLPRGRRHTSPLADGSLEKIAIPWRSPVPLTRNELEKSRKQFWETAPAYGGHSEIWQVLQEAITVGHSDMDTARALLQGAGVTAPSGKLTEAYDEQGFKYIIPVYCLCDPENSTFSLSSSYPSANEIEYKVDDWNLVRFESMPQRNLCIRTSSGDDTILQVPDHPDIQLGHVRRLFLTAYNLKQPLNGKVEFFWSGHGPLRNQLKISDLPGFLDKDSGPLQVWLLDKVFKQPNE